MSSPNVLVHTLISIDAQQRLTAARALEKTNTTETARRARRLHRLGEKKGRDGAGVESGGGGGNETMKELDVVGI